MFNVILHVDQVGPQNGKEPTILEAQGQFQWPHFVLTEDVLIEVDLHGDTGDNMRVQLFNSHPDLDKGPRWPRHHSSIWRPCFLEGT